ncbi:MAG: glycosyltransferase [Arenicellales bacterium]|nr:glycosyltransferase [Arenicellales bacterium]
MKSIVVLTTSFPRSEPGSEAAGSFVVDLCESLGRLCRVTVVAPGARDVIENHTRFSVYRYRSPDKPLSTMRVYHPFDAFNIFQALAAGRSATNRAVHDTKPDLLVALWALPSGFWARNVARQEHIPFVVWCLGSDIWSLGRIPIVRTILKGVLSSADRVYADGYGLAREVSELVNSSCDFLPSSRAIHIDEPLPARNASPYRLIFIGRWHPNKGIDILLKALSLLDTGDWRRIERIDIYGGGTLHKVVEAEVSKLSAKHRPIFLHGYIDKNQAIAAIQQSDWIIIPSRIESIPVIFSDAMQCLRPVICTPVGDLPELCDRKEVGYCVGEVSPIALTEGIRRALSSNPIQFEDGMRSYAETFKIESVAQHLAELADIKLRE